MRFHKEGFRYIFIATIVWALLIALTIKLYLTYPVVFILLHFGCFLLWFWVLWFFRLPRRTFMGGEDKIVAPADGKVVVIEEVFEPEYFQDKRLQVSIFMSPLNVHVNRNPISGTVKLMKYHAGKYLVAWHPKSSLENERTTLVIANSRIELLLRQIAGAMARRICFYVKEGDEVKQNEEFGFIRFGSRVDLFLPLNTKLNVKIGDIAKGGVTIIGQVI